jgi:hypothetical protein
VANLFEQTTARAKLKHLTTTCQLSTIMSG